MKLIASEESDYTLVNIEADSEGIFAPEELKNICSSPNIKFNKGIILSGRAPIWVFASLVHFFHPAAWVATYDPRLRAGVVVATHTRGVSIGQLIPLIIK